MIRYSRSQGFAHAFLVIGLVVALLGALGFIFWQNFIHKESVTTGTETQVVQKEDKNTNKDQTIDTSIYVVDIMMQSEVDINKLPDYTPLSFKNYIANILKQNKTPGTDCDNATPAYKISKISQVNIRGGMGMLTQDSQGCPGGAPVVWVLTPSGTWDEASLNGPMCKSENGGLIYEEFMPECYVDSNASSLVKNPNGSITSLNN